MSTVTPDIAPQILLSGSSGTSTRIDGGSISWPAGVALHVRAVNTIDQTAGSTFLPTTGSGTAFLKTEATPNNTRFDWNFGDTTSGAGDTNALVGFNAAHIYDTAQPYTLTLVATDLNNVQAIVTVTVNVTAATGKTIYVDDQATPGGTGTMSSPLKDFASAFSAYQSAKSTSTPITQILFKRGGIFSVTSGGETSGMDLSNLLIGQYGSLSSAPPKLNVTGAGVSYILNPLASTTNLTIQDLYFESSVASGSSAPAIMHPLGTNVAMRRCTFGTSGVSGTGFRSFIIDDSSGGSVTLDGLLLDQNIDSGNGVPQYEIGLFGYDNDVVIVGNTLTGGSTGQDMVRFDSGAYADGRVLIERNTFTPTSTTFDVNMTLRGSGYYEYVSGNTFNGIAGVGNPKSATVSNLYPNGYGFKWVAFDSNRNVGGKFGFNGDEYHVVFRNNVVERYTGDSLVTGYAFANLNEAGYVSTSTGFGTQDLEILSNTVYVDAATLTSANRYNQQLVDLTGTEMNSSGGTVATTQGAVIVNNLEVDSGGQFAPDNHAVAMYSKGQIVTDFTNVFPAVTSGANNVITINGTDLSVASWNTASYRRSVNTANTTYNGAAYDDLAQAITINHDSTVTSFDAPNVPYAVTSTSPAGAMPYPGDQFDYYGNVRTGSTWTPGAVQTGGLPPTSPTPTPTYADVGSPTIAGGHSTDASGNVTLTGGGGDISGTSDSFYLDYLPLSGDGTVSAQVTAQSGTGISGYAKAGVIMRASTAANAAEVLLALTPTHGVVMAYRPTAGASLTTITYFTGGTTNVTLRLVRGGNTIAGQYQVSGSSTWVTLGSVNVSLGSGTLAGLALASANGVSNTATFAGFAVTPAAQPQLVLNGGTASNDGIYIKADSTAGYVDVWTGGATPGSSTSPTVYALSSYSSIVVNGSTGGENVTVDTSAGNPLPAGGLSFAGSAAASNVLLVIGTTGADTFQDSSTSVVINNASVGFANVGTVRISPLSGLDSLYVLSGITYIPAGVVGGGLVTRQFSYINVASGAQLVVVNPTTNHSDRSVLVTLGLSVASGGILNLGANDMIVRTGNLAALTALAAAGYAGGAWNGTGLTSYAAAGDASHVTALGVVQASAAANTTSFDGVSISASDVLIKYTYYGDTDLNGVVNSTDQARLTAGGSSGWASGDLNYDGVVSSADQTLFNYGNANQGSAL